MYQELYDAWRREKLSKEPQTIPKNFFERAAEYIKKLRENQRVTDNRTMKGRLLTQELNNSRKLISEILATRFQKILDSSLLDEKPIPTGSLTLQEEGIYEGLLLTSTRCSRLKKSLFEGRQIDTSASAPKNLPQKILVRFACEIPAIIGVDLKTYGPFKPEDVATLPAENARALIHQGAAVRVEIEED